MLTVDGLPQLLFSYLQQIHSLLRTSFILVGIQDFTAVDGSIAVKQTNYSFHCDRFSRTTFPNDCDRLALLQIKVDTTDSMDDTRVGAEGNIQILDF